VGISGGDPLERDGVTGKGDFRASGGFQGFSDRDFSLEGRFQGGGGVATPGR
jgi:hypothetical protein